MTEAEKYMFQWTVDELKIAKERLRWRDATKEEPEINKDVLFRISSTVLPLIWRFDGEYWWTDNGNYVKARDGNQWIPIPNNKERG